jgi:S1/P1 Nuclease
MRGLSPLSMLTACIACFVTPALTWWDEGHMQIAYVAYRKLDAQVKEKVDTLLRLNPDYAKWTAGAPDEGTARLWAFMRASVWADDIKAGEYGYVRDNVHSTTAGQNIGYADHNQHSYWHYKDIKFSPEGTALPPLDPVDLVTQTRLMITALAPSSGASDDVRSYDLVWLLHLAGDAHQPLHAVARFTRQIPNGDAGGNAESVIPATGETVVLHAYWDGLLGGYSSPYAAARGAEDQDGLAGIAVNEAAANISDPQAWIEESAELAKQYAYAPPVSLGRDAIPLNRDYETKAHNIARSQAALAAARLANLLNSALR